MVKVSVIMPSLNVVKYISKCMESVLTQNLQEIEILAIDAGSTDGTLEILRTYAQKDNRVKLILSEKKSYGFQVNKGISLAKGQYICIVETDDVLAEAALEKMYSAVEDYSADYVKGYFKYFYNQINYEDKETNVKQLSQCEYDERNGMVMLVPKNRPELVLSDYYVWTGMYKREFLDTIRCNETPGAAYQDIGFLLQIHSKANKAVYLDELVYYYRKDNDNASCYNKNAFTYLLQEYNHVEKTLTKLDKEWIAVCRCKLFRQMNVRFMIMAESGGFWSEAKDSIDDLIGILKESIKNERFYLEMLSKNEQIELENMLCDVDAYYNYCEKKYASKKGDIKYLCQMINERKIIVYGCGMWGRFLARILRTYTDKQIFAFCDSNEMVWNSCIGDVRIISPEEATQDYKNSFFVIACKNSDEEIKKRLLKFGIDDSDIFVYKYGLDDSLFRLDIE